MIISKSPLQFLIILLLVFSLVLSFNAVPTTRSLLVNWKKSSIQTTLNNKLDGGPELRTEEENFDEMENEFMVEGRIDLESNDYPGTGANNRHVPPKTPGRA